MRNLLVAGLALALLAGCSGRETASSKVAPMGDVEDIEVDTMRVARENGFLTVKVKLTNTSSHNRTLYYRFAWLDSDGFPSPTRRAGRPCRSTAPRPPSCRPLPRTQGDRLPP